MTMQSLVTLHLLQPFVTLQLFVNLFKALCKGELLPQGPLRRCSHTTQARAEPLSPNSGLAPPTAAASRAAAARRQGRGWQVHGQPPRVWQQARGPDCPAAAPETS